MESIKVFLDTDVLINWLSKEEDPNTGEKLWEAPYKILKAIESGKIFGMTTLLNFMEILFVLRRKKRWKDNEIVKKTKAIHSMANFDIFIPTQEDIILGYNIQMLLEFDPFDSIYYAVGKRYANHIITRDSAFIKNVNTIEKCGFALTPEEFLESFY